MHDTQGGLIAPFNGISPQFGAPLAFVGSGASVLGRATLGAGAWLGPFSVIRADGHFVTIGDDFHIGASGTVHIAHDVYPTHIGHRVTAGRSAVIHACTVGDDCVIDNDAVVLDGSVIGPGAVIAAGSIVYPRTELEGGWLYAGSPAKPVARLSAEDLAAHHARLRHDRDKPQGTYPVGQTHALDCFVAPSARIWGTVDAGEDVGIWYGCTLNAGAGHCIKIGPGSNIQDNTTITCEAADVVIASDVTIGHNVTLTDCRIDANSLIGIGSRIAAGTHVETDVLVAAGTETKPGQVLTSGHVWAGRPARALRPMNDKMRKVNSDTLPNYIAYARAFAKTEHAKLDKDAPQR